MSSRSLRLEGSWQSGARKYLRAITVKRGGLIKQGIVELTVTGKAPGGFPMIHIHVPVFDLAQWLYKALVWIGENFPWAVTEEQLDKEIGRATCRERV